MLERCSARNVGRHGFLNLSSSSSKHFCFLLTVFALLFSLVLCSATDEYVPIFRTTMNLTYYDPVAEVVRSESEDVGRYSLMSRKDAESGLVHHARIVEWSSCVVVPTAIPAERWIALVDRAACRINSKIPNVNALRNASAIVFYNSDGDAGNEVDAITRSGPRDEAVYVIIPKSKGERIAALVDNGTRVHMHVYLSSTQPINPSSINRTSMLFLAISFIILMIISMAWLVFYYVQRSRYTYAKQRLSRRLMSAAKKAISKMPLQTVRGSDDRTDPGFDLCAICIEGYKSSDVVRILPCKHIFHKHCIDPWLMEQRNCPICKTDILKSFGLQVRQESSANVDTELGSASFGYSEFGPMDSVRDFDSDGVEIVHFQLAHIEHHPPAPPAAQPAPSCSSGGATGGCVTTPQRPRSLRDSSDDCDATDESSENDIRGGLLTFHESPGVARERSAVANDTTHNVVIPGGGDASVVVTRGAGGQAADRIAAVSINHRASVHRSCSMAPNEISPDASSSGAESAQSCEGQSLMMNRCGGGGSQSDVGS